MTCSKKSSLSRGSGYRCQLSFSAAIKAPHAGIQTDKKSCYSWAIRSYLNWDMENAAYFRKSSDFHGCSQTESASWVERSAGALGSFSTSASLACGNPSAACSGSLAIG